MIFYNLWGTDRIWEMNKGSYFGCPIQYYCKYQQEIMASLVLNEEIVPGRQANVPWCKLQFM